MRALSLLFDPRGAIDRRTFWSGLIQRMIVSVAVFAALTLVDGRLAWAALPGDRRSLRRHGRRPGEARAPLRASLMAE